MLQVRLIRSLPERSLRKTRSQILGHLNRLRKRTLLQDQCEFVAAKATGKGFLHARGFGTGADRLIPGLMTIRVVDALEIVDVENDGRQAPVRRDHPGARFSRLLEEAAPIAQPGERIDGREPDCPYPNGLGN